MAALRYQKKKVIVDAIQWDGNNAIEVLEFLGQAPPGVEHIIDLDRKVIVIRTQQLEGDWRATLNDFILRDERGRISVTNPLVFERLYEPYPSETLRGDNGSSQSGERVPAQEVEGQVRQEEHTQ